MGPGLWLSSLPLHSSEVPERHLSDLNWKDGEMRREKFTEKVKKQDRSKREEGGYHVGG